MFKRLWGFLCGYYVITIPEGLRGKVYDILFRHGVEFFGERNSRKGKLTLCVSGKYRRILEGVIGKWEEEGVAVSAERGVPVFLHFLVRRPGILLGMVVFCLWSFVSQRIIWDLRIEGNKMTPDSEIIELLCDLGCGYGDWIPSIDYDDVHAKFTARSDTIGWISVFMNGTVAEVQVREIVKDERSKHDDEVFANVVASEGGEIEIVRVFEGQAAVKKGDVVKPGDVVISGVMEKKDMNFPEGGVRYEYADGEVIAKTVRRIDVEISRIRAEKQYTGAQTVSKRIKIFGNVVNILKNTGITYGKYDKIDKIERVSFLGLCSLPVWIEETVVREYIYETKEIPAEQAVSEGLAELRRLTDEALEDGELLSKTVSSFSEEGRYIINCVLYIRRDIGETAEFRADAFQ